VESTVDAQRRLYRLKPEALQEVDAWLAQFRRFWSAHGMLSNATSTAWISQHQRKGRRGEDDTAQTANETVGSRDHDRS